MRNSPLSVNGRKPIEAEVLFDILLLVDERQPNIDVIRRMSQGDRERVADWAGAVHFSASDNIVRKKRLVPPTELLECIYAVE